MKMWETLIGLTNLSDVGSTVCVLIRVNVAARQLHWLLLFVRPLILKERF